MKSGTPHPLTPHRRNATAMLDANNANSANNNGENTRKMSEKADRKMSTKPATISLRTPLLTVEGTGPKTQL